MKSIKVFILFLIVCFANAQDYKGLFKKESFVAGNDTLKYQIMYPKNFDQTREYPLVIILHGAGERGNDNERQLVHGASLFATQSVRDQFPAIVIFPQCPTDEYWANVKVDRNKTPFGIEFYPISEAPTKPLAMVIALIKKMNSEKSVNSSKIYVGGLSMGGMGTLELIAREPRLFAAAFSICGASGIEEVPIYANQVPVWLFHGAKDDIVNPLYSINIAEALLKAGAHPYLSLYGSDNHNSWDSAFSESDLLPWLFSHSKN